MPATHNEIAKLLQSDKFTEGEKSYIRFQVGLAGGFEQKIWAAIVHADMKNLKKLEKGFPEYVAGYKSWTQGDLHARIEMMDVWI